MSAAVDPLAVFDCTEADWPPPNLEQLLAWARIEGLGPIDIWRLEIYVVDCPYARVFAYEANEQGTRYCWVRHDHNEDGEHCEIAKQEWTRPLSSLPPVECVG